MTQNRPYFAYGSNLDFDDLAKWCQQTGSVFPVEKKSGVRAWIPDFEARYDYYGEKRNGGVLNICKSKGQAVPGMLFELAPGGLDSLDRKEGVPFCYKRISAPVITEDGTLLDALTYQVIPENIDSDYVKPSQEYADIVRKGLAECDLDNRMHLAAAANHPLPWIVNRLFAYGTLMQGESRFDIIDFEKNILSSERGKVNGRLYNLGEYPGMRHSNNPESIVKGDLFHLNHTRRTLDILDKVEGFNGYDQIKDSLYTRTIAEVKTDSGLSLPSWLYLYNRPEHLTMEIESGDWKSVSGKTVN